MPSINEASILIVCEKGLATTAIFAGSGTKGLVPDPVTGYTGTRMLQETGLWAEPPGLGGGEANVGENLGATGSISLYAGKTGVNLKFYGLRETSDVDITLTTAQEIEFYLKAGAVTNSKLANVATATFKGRFTAGTGAPEDLDATQARGILNVEDGADVTDFDNTAAAGAVMDDYFSDDAGVCVRFGVAAYDLLKFNLTATTAPGSNDDSGDGYTVGSMWIDTALDKAYFCTDAAVGSAVWKEVGGAGGGGSVNGAANVGTGGVGLFKDLSGDTLRFRKINAASTKISVVLDGGNDEVDLDVVEAQLLLQNLGGAVTDGQIPAGIARDSEVTAAIAAHEAAADPHTGYFRQAQAAEIQALTEKVTPDGADVILIEDSAASGGKKKVQIGNLPTGGGGEVNLGANVGTAGVGIFKNKTGVTLNFKKVNAGSSKITITDDTGNDEIDIDIAEAQLLLQNLGGAVTDGQIPASIARDSEVTAAISAHEGASDPHTGYQKETEKGNANGYASLDGSGLVPDGQIPASIARDSEVTAAISAHEGLSDPHPVYTTSGELAAAITAHEGLSDPHAVYQRESEKNAAAGYAGLNSHAQVATVNLRRIERDRHRLFMQAVAGVSAGYSQYGMPGLPTTVGIMSPVSDSLGAWVRHTTAGLAADGEGAGIETTSFDILRAEWNPDFVARIRTPSSLTNCQIWVGLIGETIGSLTAPAGFPIAAFRFIQGTDSRWTSYTCDGTATTEVKTTNFGTPETSVAASTVYELWLSFTGSAVRFWVNGVQCTADHSTTIPTGGSRMGFVAITTHMAASAKSFDISRILIEHL